MAVEKDRSVTIEPGLQSKIISACSGAIVTSLLMTPFDVVKTRQQSQTLIRADTLLPALREWRATHWVPRNARPLVDTSLYSGPSENNSSCRKQPLTSRTLSLRRTASLCLCTDLPLQADNNARGLGKNNNFFTADAGGSNAKEMWKRLYRDLIALPYRKQERGWQHMASVGRAVPLQTNTSVAVAGERITGTLAGMRHIAQTEGLRTLWRGLTPTLAASGPSTVIYFVGYDYLRQWMGRQMRQRESMAAYEKYASLLGGCIARTSAVTAIAPLELVRTRMQSSATHDFRTVMQDVSTEVRRGGLRILWRGLVPTLWRDVPFSALYWFGYERWRELVYEPLLTPPGIDSITTTSRLAIAFCSGASSGAVAAMLTTPFDLAKTRRQIERYASPRSDVVQHKSLLRMIRYIAATEGTRGLFAGLAPRLMKVVPSCAIMISSYELGKQMLSQ